MKENIQILIISSIIKNKDFSYRAFPHLKLEYFEAGAKEIYSIILEYYTKYNSLPILDAIHIALEDKKMQSNLFEQTSEFFTNLVEYAEQNVEHNVDWLIDETEKWAKDRAYHIAISEAITALENKDNRGKIPNAIEKALSISFDNSVGLDYAEDAAKRHDFYCELSRKIPFSLDMLNKITDGGLPTKSLTVFAAGTSVGKSLTLCSFAADNILDGYNVAYFTLELSKEEVGKRLDANLLNMSGKDLSSLSKSEFLSRTEKNRQRLVGNVHVIDYPPGTASILNFKSKLQELKSKKNFVPDIIYIDYINLAISAVLPISASQNSYGWIKKIAEEFRELGHIYDVPVVSVTQITRDAQSASDLELRDLAESVGLAYTADLIVGLLAPTSDALKGRLLVKQMKNRNGDKFTHNKFYIGIDYPKMRIYHIDDSDVPEDLPALKGTSKKNKSTKPELIQDLALIPAHKLKDVFF